MTVNERTGVIHDIGYQRYTGARLGRRYVVGSLFTHSLRTAYGLGRSGKAKVFPWGVVGILVLVAAVVSAVRAGVGQVVLPYDEFPNAVVLLVVLFCAVIAPELVSRDLHSGVLQLYFARPLRPVDYAMAKLAAMVVAVWLLLAGPQLLMFVAGAFTVDGIRQVWDEVGALLPGLAYSAIMAVVFGPLVLLIASLMRRRTVAAAVVVGAFIVTTPVVGVLNALGDATAQQLSFLFSPMTLVAGVRQVLFGDGGMPIGDMGPVYVVVAAALALGSAGLLVARYRRAAI
ncbi:MAG: ABC transporter permease [Micromonosporaceae bacterium]